MMKDNDLADFSLDPDDAPTLQMRTAELAKTREAAMFWDVPTRVMTRPRAQE